MTLRRGQERAPAEEDTAELPVVREREAADAAAAATTAATTATAAGAAFDGLYQRTAAGLNRLTFLLTGRHALAREAVEHAFHLAWERWPEVATDPDPAGWVRAAAFEYVQTPWRRLRPGRRAGRRGTAPFGEAEDGELFAALLALPMPYRSAVVLYDGVGLGLAETAAELEASTPATAGRLTHAHEALADSVPELRELPPGEQTEVLHERLRRFADAQPVRTLPVGAARHRSERRTDRSLRRYAMLACAIALGAAVSVVFDDGWGRERAPTPPSWSDRSAPDWPEVGARTPLAP